MRFTRRLVIAWMFLLLACQPRPSSSIFIVDEERISRIETTEQSPAAVLDQAGVMHKPHDQVLLNGVPFPLDGQLPELDVIHLQIRRAVPLTVISPEGQQVFQTAALNVGRALVNAGFQLLAADSIDPLPGTPIQGPMTVTISPALEMTIQVGEKILNIRSSDGTVGDVLAGAGIPLNGLDVPSPPELEAIPADGQIRVVKVTESVETDLQQVPFTTEVVESQEIPLGQEQLIQPGVNGLSMVRTRIRFEDGTEVDRSTGSRVVIREPQTRIVAGGSQIVLAPLPANGIPADYWLALEMYATVYSPCQSGTGGCSYGTASGAPAGKGIVAVDYSIYSYLAGMKVYVPGYGFATIGDTGGGPIIETALGVSRTRWIDLGFDEGGIVDMTGWVTVYFLAPAPAEIPYFLR